MPTTIIKSFTGAYEFEPDTSSDTARDGITSFDFSIVGNLASINTAFLPDESINNIPDQPSGSFRVVRRRMEHIAGDPANGLYRLSVSGEGGTGNSALFVSETSYAMQTYDALGVVQSTGQQNISTITYKLIWLYPSVTITTNSQSADPSNAVNLAKSIVGNMSITAIKERPTDVNLISGATIANNSQLNIIYVTGSSVEKAGALYRVRATASKGIYII